MHYTGAYILHLYMHEYEQLFVQISYCDNYCLEFDYM